MGELLSRLSEFMANYCVLYNRPVNSDAQKDVSQNKIPLSQLFKSKLKETMLNKRQKHQHQNRSKTIQRKCTKTETAIQTIIKTDQG